MEIDLNKEAKSRNGFIYWDRKKVASYTKEPITGNLTVTTLVEWLGEIEIPVRVRHQLQYLRMEVTNKGIKKDIKNFFESKNNKVFLSEIKNIFGEEWNNSLMFYGISCGNDDPFAEEKDVWFKCGVNIILVQEKEQVSK